MSETLWTPAPWSIAMMPAVEFRGEVAKPATPMRDNDGSFRIGAGVGEDRKPVATAVFQAKAKRGEAYRTEDPEGLANARLIAAAPEMAAYIERWAAKGDMEAAFLLAKARGQ